MKNFILFIFIVFLFFYIHSLNNNINIEHFTPSINKIYRPIMRNSRIISEGFYNKTTTKISNLLRKFGIM